MQCDKGGIKHILGGANVMAPGLTSEGGIIDEEAVVGEVIAITVEGKHFSNNFTGKDIIAAIGRMAMSPEQIKTDNKGIAIELETYLMDGLWNFKVE